MSNDITTIPRQRQSLGLSRNARKDMSKKDTVTSYTGMKAHKDKG